MLGAAAASCKHACLGRPACTPRCEPVARALPLLLPRRSELLAVLDERLGLGAGQGRCSPPLRSGMGDGAQRVCPPHLRLHTPGCPKPAAAALAAAQHSKQAPQPQAKQAAHKKRAGWGGQAR